MKIGQRKLPSGKISLYLDYVHQDNRFRENLKGLVLNGDTAHDKKIMRIAKQVAADREIKLAENLYFPGRTNQHQTFTKFFFEVVESNPKRRMQYALQKLNQYTGDTPVRFSELSQRWWESFEAWLKEKGFSQNSIFLIHSAIKTVILRAIDEGLLNRDPLSRVKVGAVEGRIGYLELAEVQQLARTDVAQERHFERAQEIKRAFLFGCFTGLRWSDCRNLTWGNYNSTYLDIKIQKTGKRALLPLTNSAIKMLEARRKGEPGEHIFALPPQVKQANITLKKWAAKAGIEKDISFHWSRKTFASLAREYEVHGMAIRDLLSHSDMVTTMKYALSDVEKNRKELGKLPDIEI